MSRDDFQPYLTIAARLLERHIEESRKGEAPVLRLTGLSDLKRLQRSSQWIENGGMTPEDFEGFLDDYLDGATRLHHPRYLAHQVAVPHFASAIADWINGMTNNGMAIFEMGPPAVALELAALDWLLAKVPWPAGAGVLTHGGSLANLTALLAARAQAFPKAWKEGTPREAVLMVPQVSHYSVARAASIMGLGSDALVTLPCDANGVTSAAPLGGLLADLRRQGRRVLAVVGNACATATGLYDPLDEMAEACSQAKVWFHVDGAHGASALLSPRFRELMRGAERADSMVWDAHKMLQTSTLCAAVLFRDAHSVDEAFQQHASYLGHEADVERLNLYPRALECTKAPLGLKLFLPLALIGESAMSDHVESLFDLTSAIRRTILGRPGFECPYSPESNILCFRRDGDDALQVEIRRRLLEEGRFHISTTQLLDRTFLRLSVMNPATRLSDIEALLDRIESIEIAESGTGGHRGAASKA